MADTETVLVDVKGDLTQQDYKGPFKAKTCLSHGDYLVQDRIRRELIGPAPGPVAIRVQQTADMLSQLAVRITDAPGWWTGSGGAAGVPGYDLKDDNVLEVVYDKVMGVDRKVVALLQKQAEQAKTDLRKDSAEG